MSPTFAALGIDHRHIFGMAGNMQDVGATFKLVDGGFTKHAGRL